MRFEGLWRTAFLKILMRNAVKLDHALWSSFWIIMRAVLRTSIGWWTSYEG